MQDEDIVYKPAPLLTKNTPLSRGYNSWNTGALYPQQKSLQKKKKEKGGGGEPPQVAGYTWFLKRKTAGQM